MKRMKKIALISMLTLLACGSVFAKGKKAKAEAEETELDKPETADILNAPYDDSFAK